MNNQQTEKFKPLDKRDRFDRFVLEYAAFLGGGNFPGRISQDMKYSFEMQKKRLQENGVHVEAEAESRTAAGERQVLRNWKDTKYRGGLECKSVQLDRRFYVGGRQKIRVKRRELFYRTETDLQAGCPSENELYSCPACGAPIRLGQLADIGCTYCSAKFTRAQLFPLTTNYYLVEDPSRIGEKRNVFKWILTGLPLSLICSAVAIAEERGILCRLSECITMGSSRAEQFGALCSWFGQALRAIPMVFLPDVLPKLLLSAVLLSPVAGFMCWFLFTIAKVFWKAGESMVLLWCLPAKKKFEKYMKDLYPDYSFDYFTDKVTGLYRMLIFAEKPEDCLVYSGKPLPEFRRSIIHSDFTGALGIRGMYQKDGLCFVRTTAYADTVRKSGNRLWKERDKIELELCKKIDAEVNLNFSPFRIICKGCGSSFDAVKDKVCPYCKKEYMNDYSEWTVRSLRMKKLGVLSRLLGLFAAVFLIPLVLLLAAMFFPVLIPLALAVYFIWGRRKK